MQLLDFDKLTKPLKDLDNTEVERHGYAISKGFEMLLLQYIEDLIDRELERYLQENLAAKLFCDFLLETLRLDFSYFSKLRSKKAGLEKFNNVTAPNV